CSMEATHGLAPWPEAEPGPPVENRAQTRSWRGPKTGPLHDRGSRGRDTKHLPWRRERQTHSLEKISSRLPGRRDRLVVVLFADRAGAEECRSPRVRGGLLANLIVLVLELPGLLLVLLALVSTVGHECLLSRRCLSEILQRTCSSREPLGMTSSLGEPFWTV